MFPAPAVNVRFCAPFKVLLKVITLPFELIATAAVDNVVAPKLTPSKLDQLSPSSSTVPNEVAVSPLPKVTSPSNFKSVAAPATIPELAATVLRNSIAPVTVLSTVNAAPTPSPNAVTAPETDISEIVPVIVKS